jgi:hypothetical protein
MRKKFKFFQVQPILTGFSCLSTIKRAARFFRLAARFRLDLGAVLKLERYVLPSSNSYAFD